MVKPRENRVPIMMSDAELKAVDDWRFANRVATRSEAVRRLVRIGLATDDWIDQAEKSVDYALDSFMKRFHDAPEAPVSSEDQSLFKSLMFAWLDVLTVTRVAAVIRETGNTAEALAEAKHIRTEVLNEKIRFFRDAYPNWQDIIYPNKEG